MDLNKVTSAFHYELPHTSTGDVDWEKLGNMLFDRILEEVQSAASVDAKFGNESLAADKQWKFVNEENEVVVLKKRITEGRQSSDRKSKRRGESNIQCYMGRGIVGVPLKTLAEFLSNLHTRQDWDKNLVNARTVKTISESDVIRHIAHEDRRYLVKVRRDLFYYEKMGYVEGKYVQSAMSIFHPDYPSLPGYTRGKIHPGTGFVLEKYKGSNICTLISYIIQLDCKRIPLFVVNRVLHEQITMISRVQELFCPSKASGSSDNKKKKPQRVVRQYTWPSALQHIPEHSSSGGGGRGGGGGGGRDRYKSDSERDAVGGSPTGYVPYTSTCSDSNTELSSSIEFYPAVYEDSFSGGSMDEQSDDQDQETHCTATACKPTEQHHKPEDSTATAYLSPEDKSDASLVVQNLQLQGRRPRSTSDRINVIVSL